MIMTKTAVESMQLCQIYFHHKIAGKKVPHVNAAIVSVYDITMSSTSINYEESKVLGGKKLN